VFIRKKKNRNGSVSITIIDKSSGKYRVVKSFGSGKTTEVIELLHQKARHFIKNQTKQIGLFPSVEDSRIQVFLSTLKNSQVQVVGPEKVFGRIYDSMGFSTVEEPLFRHLVISRLAYPGSKLKTIDYLKRYLSIEIGVDAIYRFLDKLHSRLKDQVEQVAFAYTKKLLGGNVSIVFYDLTTLHFEASDEDDLRRTGFSKAGKHQHPQIFLGLLVSLGGYAIGYEIFEGNIYEGKTLIPTLRKFEEKFNLSKPVVVADAGLLSNDNIALLEENKYPYILGARIKNETKAIQRKILDAKLKDGKYLKIQKSDKTKLVVCFALNRAFRDEKNRKRGIMRLEKNLKSGKLTKSHINNRGYNKYLKLKGEVKIEIDYEKFNADNQWDGLKGYLTNTSLTPKQIIDSYKQLWQIEKAFRISKTDLKIRPIFHRLYRRIEAHICLAFAAYNIYKVLEKSLYENKCTFSVKKAADLTHTIYQLNIILPESKEPAGILLNMDDDQRQLIEIIAKNF
jgi:transposase